MLVSSEQDAADAVKLTVYQSISETQSKSLQEQEQSAREKGTILDSILVQVWLTSTYFLIRVAKSKHTLPLPTPFGFSGEPGLTILLGTIGA